MSSISIGIDGSTLTIVHVETDDSVVASWTSQDGVTRTLYSASTDPMWQYAADEKSGIDSGRLKMTVSEWWENFTLLVTELVLEMFDAPIEYTAQQWQEELTAKIYNAMWKDDKLV